MRHGPHNVWRRRSKSGGSVQKHSSGILSPSSGKGGSICCHLIEHVFDFFEGFLFGEAFAVFKLLTGNGYGFCQFCLLAPRFNLVPCAFKVRDAHHHARAASVLRDDDGTMRPRSPHEAVVEGVAILGEGNDIFVEAWAFDCSYFCTHDFCSDWKHGCGTLFCTVSQGRN